MRARLVHGAVLAAVTTTAIAWVSLDKSVTVDVDGESRIVMTHAATVGEVLQRAGVDVGEHDTVAPAPSVEVKDGSQIVIRRRRLVTVQINSVQRGVWVNAADVDEVLHQIGVEADERAFVSASRSSRVPSDGFTLHVRLPATVHLTVDGKDRAVTTTAPTVADLLDEQKIRLEPGDKVSLPLGHYPAEGSKVSVTSLRGMRISRTRPIAFRNVEVEDPTMLVGTSILKQRGIPGVRVVYFRQHIVGGKVVEQTPDGQRVAREPQDRIVLVGVKAKAATAAKPSVKSSPTPEKKKTSSTPAKPRAKTAVENLNWRALAACESGNNPRAVSRGGRYRGLYQFMMSTWHGVGGKGDPIDASRDEQTYRAQLLYKRRGAGAWGACGSRLYR